MKNILVPTDFSDVSLNAIKVAADIAKKDPNTVLTIVHVYDMAYIWSGTWIGSDSGSLLVNKEETARIQKELQEKMHDLVKSDFLQGIKLHTLILADIDIHEITEHEKVGHQDLVVMGTHGVKGIKEVFIGSNAEKFIRHSSIPVLAVKEYNKTAHFENMVFASDFSDDAVENFDRVKNLAQLFGSHIFLVKVITPINFEDSSVSEASINAFIEKTGITNCTRHIYNHISVEEGILKFAHKVNADVIALETHGRTGISHIVNGSLTEDVANHATIPVISVKID